MPYIKVVIKSSVATSANGYNNTQRTVQFILWHVHSNSLYQTFIILCRLIKTRVPINIRVLFFGPRSAKSFARCVTIAASNSTCNTKPLHCQIHSEAWMILCTSFIMIDCQKQKLIIRKAIKMLQYCIHILTLGLYSRLRGKMSSQSQAVRGESLLSVQLLQLEWCVLNGQGCTFYTKIEQFQWFLQAITMPKFYRLPVSQTLNIKD